MSFCVVAIYDDIISNIYNSFQFFSIMSMLIWKTSCVRFMPNGSLLKRYRHMFVWNVLRILEMWSNITDQYPDIASSFENIRASHKRLLISSDVLQVWCGRIIALLRSFGSKHIRNFPVLLRTYVRLDTHLVGSSTFTILPLFIIDCSSSATSARICIGTWVCVNRKLSWESYYSFES